MTFQRAHKRRKRLAKAMGEQMKITTAMQDAVYNAAGMALDEHEVDAIIAAVAPLIAQEAAREIETDDHAPLRQITDAFKAQAQEIAALRAALSNPPKHKFWGAGEPDCPADIKASNGELHTLRCKVCGGDGRDAICHAAFAPAHQDGDACDAIYWKEKATAAITLNKMMVAALDDIATDTREHGDDEVAMIYRMQDRAKNVLSEIRGQSSDGQAAT